MDHSMIVVALTPLFVKNFNSYVCYVTFFIISVLFCLVCEHETVSINYTSFCCVSFITVHNETTGWKPSKHGQSISFSLW